MRRIAFVTASVGLGACSLFTDLGGLDEPAPSTVVVLADASGGDGGATNGSSDSGAADGAGGDGGDTGAKRYARTLKLTGDQNAPNIDAGYTYCARLPATVVATAVTQKKMRADLGDLRVYGANGPIDAVVDPLAVGRAEACFKLERAIAPGVTDTYELRYGDPDAQPQPVTRSSFFSFYEGFTGTSIDASKWQVWGSPVVTGQRMELRKGSEHGITTTAATDGVPLSTSLEIRAEVTNPNSDALPPDGGSGGQFWYWLGFQRYGDFTPIEPWAVFIARAKLTINAEQKNESGACAGVCAQAYNIQTTEPRIYRIDRHATGTIFTYDDGTTFAAPQPAGDQAIMIRSFLVDGDVYVYWVRARPLVHPEPALVIEDERTL